MERKALTEKMIILGVDGFEPRNRRFSPPKFPGQIR